MGKRRKQSCTPNIYIYIYIYIYAHTHIHINIYINIYTYFIYIQIIRWCLLIIILRKIQMIVVLTFLPTKEFKHSAKDTHCPVMLEGGACALNFSQVT